MTTDLQNWYYRDFARTAPVHGPYTLADLAERAQTGELAYDSLVRCGDGEWLQADRVNELILALRQRRRPEYEDELSTSAEMVASTGRKTNAIDRRRLNWGRLFIVAIFLGLIGGVLMAVGFSHWQYGLLVLVGQVVSAVASVIFLCAIIRWAIEPLFGQLVDTNDRLSKIARLLKEKDKDR